MPIDSRFFDPRMRTIFYFVDSEGAPSGFHGSAINEIDINPSIHGIGATHLAEWTFLLTEYEKKFATYPFYVVSSRFHEKNKRLPSGLAPRWDDAIRGLRRLGWGYLPSYDRQAGFEDFAEYRELGRLGMSQDGLGVVEQEFGVRLISEYRYFSDFFCNYIGFASRTHFERYVEFYLPFIRRRFTEDYQVISDANSLARRRNVFRNEKPFTFFMEMISHLFFYKNSVSFFGLGYDANYEVQERIARMTQLSRYELLPAFVPLARFSRMLGRKRFIEAPVSGTAS